MILSNEKEIEVKSNFTSEGYDAKISEDDLHKLWSMLQNPYKDSISSLIREYVSNCFDSHAEANINDAVNVRMGKDDTGHYWSCEDFGVGLSPDRIQNVFINYLKSTKENSNNQIGAFGIGSKSGLSYTDVVYIRTRYNNIEYLYLLRKGEKTPRLEKLIEIPTEERNGTEIKLYIKEGKNRYGYKEVETEKFKESTKKQLCYFDNIYFQDCGINNDYKIIEGKHWKYNTCVEPFNGLHLVIGKVGYPIDWDVLNIDPIRFQVALKFEIGELDIIQTREDVRYTPRTVDAITNKIKLLKEEFEELWNKQNFELDDIYDFKHKEINRDYNLIFENISFDLEDLFGDVHSLKYFVYKPLENWYIPNDFFFGYKTVRRLGAQGRVLKIGGYQQQVTHILDRNGYVGYRINGETNTKVNKYIYDLDTKQEHKSIYLIERNTDRKLSEYVHLLKLGSLNKREKLLKIKQYQEVMSKEIIKNTKSYKDVIIDPQWLLDQKQNNVRKRVPKEVVIAKQAYNNSMWDNRYECNLNKIGNKCIIVGTEDQASDLLFWRKLFRKLTSDGKYLDTLIVAKTNIKKFKELKNVWTIEKLMSEESKIFKKVVTAYKIRKEYQFISNLNPDNYIEIYKPIAEDINSIKTLLSFWGSETDTFIEKNCVAIAEENNLFDKDLLETANRIKDYFEGLELLQYIKEEITQEEDDNGNTIKKSNFPVQFVAKYIYNYNRSIKSKTRFKRLNAYYYSTFNQEEILKWREPKNKKQIA